MQQGLPVRSRLFHCSSLSLCNFYRKAELLKMVNPSDGAKKPHIAARDIISSLPGNVIDRILELLPIGDAVKTSALARNWRHNWAAMSKLNFDAEFCRNLYLEKDMSAFKIASIITKSLLLHEGPLLDFTLYIPGVDEAIKGDIDSWILFSSRKNVKVFKLNIFYCSRTFIYTLPTHLFSCVNLTLLRLISCVFNPPSTFRGFPNLINLALSLVTVEKESFECLISSSPLLSSIFLESCLGPDKLYIYSPSLKHLHIDAGKPEFIWMRTENLRYLKLFHVSWMAENPGNGVSNLTKEFGKIPKIVSLCLGGESGDSLKFLSAGPTPSRLPSPLKFLQKVTFRLLDFGDPAQVLAAFCLIRSAPTLRKLDILDVSDTGDSVSTAVMTVLEEQCILRCLQVVRFHSLKGSKAELELIKSVLASSPSLKSMFLMRDEPADDKLYSMFSEELLKFRQALTKAEVVYRGF